MTGVVSTRHGAERFRHEAMFYDGHDDFLRRSSSFVREGLEAGERVLVIVRPHKIDSLRAELGAHGDEVYFVDMAAIGRNPARIIPVWVDFFTEAGADGKIARGIGEPIWAERTADELVECQLHESLINLAFPEDAPGWVLCPYDNTSLPQAILEEARRSHPVLSWNGSEGTSPTYRGISEIQKPFDEPLEAPPVDSIQIVLGLDTLGGLRSVVGDFATSLGLNSDRVTDVVFAVNEVATNALHHGGGFAEVQMWRRGSTMFCEVRDKGSLPSQLVGRVRPTPEQAGGRGLWSVHQICDLVQIRSTPAGSIVRLHVSLNGSA